MSDTERRFSDIPTTPLSYSPTPKILESEDATFLAAVAASLIAKSTIEATSHLQITDTTTVARRAITLG